MTADSFDRDFERVGRVYPTVADVDQRIARWQDRAFAADTVRTALAMASGQDEPGADNAFVSETIDGMRQRVTNLLLDMRRAFDAQQSEEES